MPAVVLDYMVLVLVEMVHFHFLVLRLHSQDWQTQAMVAEAHLAEALLLLVQQVVQVIV
jgi:hypothetical protein